MKQQINWKSHFLLLIAIPTYVALFILLWTSAFIIAHKMAYVVAQMMCASDKSIVIIKKKYNDWIRKYLFWRDL